MINTTDPSTSCYDFWAYFREYAKLWWALSVLRRTSGLSELMLFFMEDLHPLCGGLRSTKQNVYLWLACCLYVKCNPSWCLFFLSRDLTFDERYHPQVSSTRKKKLVANHHYSWWWSVNVTEHLSDVILDHQLLASVAVTRKRDWLGATPLMVNIAHHQLRWWWHTRRSLAGCAPFVSSWNALPSDPAGGCVRDALSLWKTSIAELTHLVEVRRCFIQDRLPWYAKHCLALFMVIEAYQQEA